MQRLALATNNRHKLEEVKFILGDQIELLTLEDIGCREELAEEQDTLEGNSLEKAEYVFNKYKISCFADDTGLEVASLNGAPGVYSARYAGPQRNADDNIALLLENLEEAINRQAQFRTVITLVSENGVYQFEGVVKGRIIEERRGTHGFGYDPVFVPDGFSETLAEMTMEEKNKISHRARAMQKLVDFLKVNNI
jgi:XTP/dITP diphosphohydrolase